MGEAASESQNEVGGHGGSWDCLCYQLCLNCLCGSSSCQSLSHCSFFLSSKQRTFVKGYCVVMLGIWKISGTQRYRCTCYLHVFIGICDCSTILLAADKTNNPSSLSVSGPPWPSSWRMIPCLYRTQCHFWSNDPLWPPVTHHALAH